MLTSKSMWAEAAKMVACMRVTAAANTQARNSICMKASAYEHNQLQGAPLTRHWSLAATGSAVKLAHKMSAHPSATIMSCGCKAATLSLCRLPHMHEPPLANLPLAPPAPTCGSGLRPRLLPCNRADASARFLCHCAAAPRAQPPTAPRRPRPAAAPVR